MEDRELSNMIILMSKVKSSKISTLPNNISVAPIPIFDDAPLTGGKIVINKVCIPNHPIAVVKIGNL